MVINNLGYIFECRQDVNGSLGVMENFRVMFKNDEQRVSLTFGIDNCGKIVVPAYSDMSLGFKPLTAMFQTKESIDNFVRSNKPYFGKLGAFSMIASGTIIFSKETGEIKSTDGLGFYVPKTTAQTVKEIVDKRGYHQPALICEKLSTVKGLNNFVVSEAIYNGYLTNFLSCLSAENTKDRNAFISAVTLKE